MTGATTRPWRLVGGFAALALLLPIRVSAEDADAGTPADGASATRAESPGTPVPARAGNPAGARRDHKAGLAKLRRGAVAEAVDQLRAGYEQDPTNATLANDLGFALLRAGRNREAEEMYRRSQALDPKRVNPYLNLADLVGASPDRWRRRGEVLSLLAKGISIASDNARETLQLQLAVAIFERRVGRLREARVALEPLISPAAPPDLRKRALDLAAAIATDEAAAALDDWPEPPLDPTETKIIGDAETLLDGQRAAAALAALEPLVARRPAATDARFPHARALEMLGRHDEAARDLTILLHVRPSHASAWRLLGMILAQHGGALEAERADEALRRALALEPSWDDLRALRARVADKRRGDPADRVTVSPVAPSRKALDLFEEAQRWMALDAPEMAEIALADALADSPGFVDAAVSLFAMTRRIPDEVPQALWDDGPGLARLASGILGLRKDETTVALTSPWLERAVAVGSAEARFERALLRSGAGERAGALEDLQAYVASDVNPPRLSEARALRASLLSPEQRQRTPVQLARLHLLADRASDADRALGGPCRPELEGPVLVELARIREYLDDRREALVCYRLAVRAPIHSARTSRDPKRMSWVQNDRDAALRRLARLAARLPAPDLGEVEEDLRRARGARVPEAALALAHLAAHRQRTDDSLGEFDAYLATARPDDPLRAEAARTAAELRARESALGHERAARRRSILVGVAVAAGLALALAFGVVLVRRLRVTTVERALRRRPEVYPELARVVAEVKHDVLKHRASALGLVTSTKPPISDIARALTEPTPLSDAVAAAYGRLRGAVAALGLTLRPLGREPVFGPLRRDLARAEALLTAKRSATTTTELTEPQIRELARLDLAIRDSHGAALTALLACGPRTRLDPGRFGAWVRAVEGERIVGESGHQEKTRWIAPALHFQELDLEVPVLESVVATVVTNLLRNAVGAVRTDAEPRIAVRVSAERDVTGRRQVILLVADSSVERVTLDQIERRDGRRGLGIMRDLVRGWGGHVLIRDEPAPFSKAIGVAFPAAVIAERSP